MTDSPPIRQAVPAPPPPPITRDRYLVAVRERRTRIVAFVLAVGILTAVIALMLKPWYTAEARLLPPTTEGGDMMSNISGLIESAALNRVGLYTTATASDLIVEVLRSRRLSEAIIHRFDLQRQYECHNLDAALKELASHVSVNAATSGIVVIRAESQNKQQAADMANFLVGELDRFNREVLNTRGKRMRQFLEFQLADAQERMLHADSAVTAYELHHGVLVTGDDSSVRGVSDMMGRRIALQVRRAYVASFSSTESPEVRSIDAELQAFDRELGEMPRIKNEGQRLTLDAAIQRKVFSLLSAQLEQARLDEMRDIPTITVLDQARPPDLKTRPKRGLMVLTAMFVAFVGTLGWVWWSVRGTPAYA